MDIAGIREKLHKMRGALSVLGGFLDNFEPANEDEKLHKKAALKSYKKLCASVEEINTLIKKDS